ncbi:MAG TPA: PQQ-binding-like beta-propeller repeat protein [Pirellulales bacterium]|jgi:outer membrane protein assembly factor BamB|nr:PQQ-binding-like beta-propeller repeat protein [Pirellulales bacterium]
MFRVIVFVCLMLLANVPCGWAAESTGDWPAWRGPRRDGRSDETGLMSSWPEGGPKLLWKAEGLGEGYSTPSVAGNLIYLMGNKDGQEWVLAVDRTKEGQGVWAFSTGPIDHGGGGYPGPRSTPTVDGNRVFALGLAGELVALDAKTGKVHWRHNLVKDFGGKVGGWGYAESVLIDDKWLLCTPGGDEATIVALLKTNGKPVWQDALGDTASYSSILPIQIEGVKQYVQFTAQGVVGVNAKNGDLFWRYDRPANGTANCSTPLFSGDGVFAASGYGTGGGLAQIKKNRKKWDATEVYFTPEMKNHHGGMVLVDGYLYGSDDPGVLRCLDVKTGKSMWQDRSCGKCSLVYADGMLYCRSEQGLMSLVLATPNGFELKGRFEQPERSDRNAWAHPVVAGGRLYLRDQDKLFCFDLREALASRVK